MIPVDQKVMHDPENGQYGDCMRACVASILELSSEDVPHFYESGSGHGFDYGIRDYLQTQNLTIMCLSWNELFETQKEAVFGLGTENVYHIISGPTERGTYHAVVGCNGEVIHDPHPSRAGLLKKDSYTFFIFNKDKHYD